MSGMKRVTTNNPTPGFYWMWEKHYTELKVVEVVQGYDGAHLTDGRYPKNYAVWRDRATLYGPIPIPAKLRFLRQRQLAVRRRP